MPVPFIFVNGTIADATQVNADFAAVASLNSPVFTGNPTAPTPPVGDNDTSIATTAFVKAQGYMTSATADGAYVNVGGDTMTGTLVVPTLDVHGNARMYPTGIISTAAAARTLTLCENTLAPGYELALGLFLQGGLWTGSIQATAGAGVGSALVLQPIGGNVGVGTVSPASLFHTTIDGVYNSDAFAGLRVGMSSVPAKIMYAGYDGTIDAAYIQAVHAGVAFKNLLLQPAGGGNVGIGTINPLANLDVAGNAFFGSQATTGDAGIEIGQGRSGSGNAYVDLHAAIGTDYETRFVRAAGANGNFAIQNAGTGTVQLLTAGSATATLSSNGTWGLSGTSAFLSSAGNLVRTGTLGATGSSAFNINWTGSVSQLWIDNVNQGTITVTCDYRVKENITPLSSTWQKVKALRPIAYTRKAYAELHCEADPAERWGFIAHELQETLLPTAATGAKDEPELIQSPDLMALTASLTRALQEAMARIEALEAQLAPASFEAK